MVKMNEGRFMVVVLLATAGCSPTLVDTTPLVDAPALLAAQVTPAETRPGVALTLRALDVGPDGPQTRALDWAFCTERPPLAAAGSLAPACREMTDPALLPLGAGSGVTAVMPADVCSRFGPDQPTPKPGQPAARPADPDPTGGYYQPVRILPPDGTPAAKFELRALCNLAAATPDQQQELDRRYRLNVNPALAALALDDATALPPAESDPGAVTPIAAGARVTLRVTWPGCPGPGEDVCGDGVCGPDETASDCPDDCATPAGCAGSESYVWFDPQARLFVTRREAINVAWFATAGAFAAARTGRSEPEAAATDSANDWIAPAASGDVWLWLVIRDSRGGVGWSSYRLRVE